MSLNDLRSVTRTNLHPEESDAGQKIYSGLQVLQSLRTTSWKIILKQTHTTVTNTDTHSSTQFSSGYRGILLNINDILLNMWTYSVHREVYPQGVVQLIQKLHKALFLHRKKKVQYTLWSKSKDGQYLWCMFFNKIHNFVICIWYGW